MQSNAWMALKPRTFKYAVPAGKGGVYRIRDGKGLYSYPGGTDEL